MPQLDKFTFASQIFWFAIIFFSLYIFLIKYVLTNTLSILRVRRWKLERLMRDEALLKLLKRSVIQNNYELVSKSIDSTLEFTNFLALELVRFNDTIEKLFLSKESIGNLIENCVDLVNESQFKVNALLFDNSKSLDEDLLSYFSLRNSIDINEVLLENFVEKVLPQEHTLSNFIDSVENENKDFLDHITNNIYDLIVRDETIIK